MERTASERTNTKFGVALVGFHLDWAAHQGRNFVHLTSRSPLNSALKSLG